MNARRECRLSYACVRPRAKPRSRSTVSAPVLRRIRQPLSVLSYRNDTCGDCERRTISPKFTHMSLYCRTNRSLIKRLAGNMADQTHRERTDNIYMVIHDQLTTYMIKSIHLECIFSLSPCLVLHSPISNIHSISHLSRILLPIRVNTLSPNLSPFEV